MSNSSVRICASRLTKKGLARCLSMEGFNNFRCKGLSDFICILGEEFLHLLVGKVRQVKLVLDIEWGNGSIVVELCNALDPHDADAVRTPAFIRKVDVTK